MLKKNKALVNDLARTIAHELFRFSCGKASEKDARRAAKKLAGYFNLDAEFERLVVDYTNEKTLAAVTTTHRGPGGQSYEIIQSSQRVEVRLLPPI